MRLFKYQFIYLSCTWKRLQVLGTLSPTNNTLNTDYLEYNLRFFQLSVHHRKTRLHFSYLLQKYSRSNTRYASRNSGSSGVKIWNESTKLFSKTADSVIST